MRSCWKLLRANSSIMFDIFNFSIAFSVWYIKVVSKKSRRTFGLMVLTLFVLSVSPIDLYALRNPFLMRAKNWFFMELSLRLGISLEISFQWFFLRWKILKRSLFSSKVHFVWRIDSIVLLKRGLTFWFIILLFWIDVVSWNSFAFYDTILRKTANWWV